MSNGNSDRHDAGVCPLNESVGVRPAPSAQARPVRPYFVGDHIGPRPAPVNPPATVKPGTQVPVRPAPSPAPKPGKK
jgi:hypothetical protein